MTTLTDTRQYSLRTALSGEVPVTVTDQGDGRVCLLLHGGGGPQTMQRFAGLLADTLGVRVVLPVHPGFAGSARPERLVAVSGLSDLYVALLDELDVHDVVVIGNSIGGWVASELALLHSPRVSAVVLLDAVGVEVPGHPIADFFSLSLEHMTALTFHDPEKFRIDPAALPPAVRAALPGNRASLGVYAGPTMSDPTLAARLADIDVPALVLWGESDQVADIAYGQAFARALPDAEFRLLADTGHVPQVETPHVVVDAIRAYLTAL